MKLETEIMLLSGLQIGPIYAVYPDNKQLNDLVEKELVNSPEYSFEGMDSSKHEMWVVDDENKILKISDLFNSINIADDIPITIGSNLK